MTNRPEKRWSLLVFCLLALGLSDPGFSATTQAAEEHAGREGVRTDGGGDGLRIGVAEADITPPVGFPMAGYYHERLADGQRDPLKAKAVVFRDDDRCGAFVIADLTGIARDLCVEVRRQASAKTGIDPAHIVVSATHSHTAPDYTHRLYDYLDDTSQVEKHAYAAKLVSGIVSAIVDADAAARPAVVDAGAAIQQTPVSFNRRFVMSDGSVQTWQGFSNPNVIRTAGPIDPEIGLLMFKGHDDQPFGVLSNFALHLDTVGGQKWSGDFPYYIEQRLRQQHGQELISVFGIGTCGDINHSDPSRSERNKTEMIGNSLAETIVAGLPELKRIRSPSLQVRSTSVNLLLQQVTERELERARQLIPAARSGEKVDFFDLVKAYKAAVLDHLRNQPANLKSTDYLSWGLSHTWQGVGEALPVDVTTMTLGNEVAIVFLPGEVFVDLGLAIKRGSPYHTTLIIELSGCVETMYLPTRAAYAGGSYEVTNSSTQPGSGEKLVEAALKLLRESASSGGK